MIYNIFPLSIYKEKVGLDAATRKIFADIIAEQNSKTKKTDSNSSETWVGGMYGELSIHLRDEFVSLVSEYPKHLASYMHQLGLQTDDLEIFITRSWGTFGLSNETISPHRHASSVLSIAYYVSLPEGSASISFDCEAHQNEPIRGLFRERRRSRAIDPTNVLTATSLAIDVEEDDIVIFPSAVLHGVRPGQQNAPRISIATDTLLLTKQVTNSEKLLPPISNWKSVSI
jgi:uncharacterized protein (TIGR02466 family)